MIVDFRNISDAFTPSHELIKIYGANGFLLWEKPNPTPGIKNISDKFIFIDNMELVSSSSVDNIMTGKIVAPRAKFAGNWGGTSSIGTTWFGKQYDSYFNETVGGFDSSAYWCPAFFQFIEYTDVEGIYLYVPEFDVYVADDSPFVIWTYTSDITEAFNIAPYLSVDPFSDSGWTTTTLKYGNVGSDTYSQDYIYKEFNTLIWPTVLIHQDQLTIHDYFGYNDPEKTNVQRRYMIKPRLVSDRNRWQTVFAQNSYSNFAGGATISSTKYNAILPYNSSPGWY